MNQDEIYEKISRQAEAIAPDLQALRRNFHQYPELGWMEMRTSAIVAALLQSYGCDEVLTGRQVCLESARMGVPEPSILEDHYQEVSSRGDVDPALLEATRGGFTGAIGILHCGEGPTVAFRFDMDALPITECPDKSHFPSREGFLSQNRGVMHACGHDGHTTVGLGTVRLLCGIREQLHGTIKFIFQPAEEGVRGAKSIVENGYLDDVDYVLGAHMGDVSDSEYCMIGVGNGSTLATVKMDVEFHGKSSHAAASPEEGKNAMLAAATAILNLHAIPRHGQAGTRVNVGKVAAGNGRNIICEHAHMEMEVRGMSTEANQFMYDYAIRILHASAQMHGCTCDVRLMGAAMNGLNNPELMDLVEQVCQEKMSLPTRRLPDAPGIASEDYSYMSERVQSHGGQSCYFMNLSKFPATAHNERFDFQEQALVNGVKAFCGIAVTLMAAKENP